MKIKVLIVLGKGGIETSKIPGTDRYQGLCYDIYKTIIQSETLKNYEFKETFAESKNYENLIEQVKEGKYDLVVGPYQYSYERMKKVNFTNIYTLSKDGIMYLKDNKNMLKSLLLNIKKIVLDVLLIPLLYLVLLGIILGYMFYYIQPKKKQFFNFRSIKLNIIRSIFSTISLLLGSKGLLTNNHNLSIIGLIFVFSIVIISMVFNYYLQAAVYEKLKLINESNIFSVKNLRNITLLSPKGYIVAKNLERMGIKIIYKDMSMSELLEYYIKNPHEANGIATDYLDGLTRIDAHVKQGLYMSHFNYGFKELTFIINKKHTDLLNKFNLEIEKQIYNLNFHKICKSYLNSKEAHLCVM